MMEVVEVVKYLFLTLLHCWWKKRIQPFLEIVCQFINLNAHLPHDPEIPLPVIHSREMSAEVHTHADLNIFIHNILKLEIFQISVKRRMQKLWHIQTRD